MICACPGRFRFLPPRRWGLIVLVLAAGCAAAADALAATPQPGGVEDAAPTVALAAVPMPVVGTTVVLSAIAADADDALANLTYAWSAVGPQTVAFSPNRTPGSAGPTATFTAAGNYIITVTVSDPSGRAASSSQPVVVRRTAVSAALTPAAMTLVSGASQTFAVAVRDQFGAVFAPAVTAVSAVGGSAAYAGSTATFTAGAATDQGRIGVVLDSTPPLAAAVDVRILPCQGQGTGLAATYYDNEDFTGTILRRIDPQVQFSWPDGPAPAIARDWWSAIWVGSLEVPVSDTYTFSTLNDDGAILSIDGRIIISDWVGHGPTWNSGAMALTAGRHELQLRYFNGQHGGGSLGLYWASSLLAKQIIPQSVLYPDIPLPVIGHGTGLAATYFDEDRFSGFTARKVDPVLDFAWAAASAPATSISPEAWSVRWLGQIEPQFTDTYAFSALIDHPFSLIINAQPVIDDASDGTERTATGRIYLQAGRRYDLMATYRATTAPSRLALSWSCALAGAPTIVPSSQLYPVREREAAEVTITSPQVVYASPAWIEGSVGHWTTTLKASLNGKPMTAVRAGAAPWYLTAATAPGRPLGVPLSGPVSTLAIDSANGRTVRRIRRVITWATIDLAHRPYGLDAIDIRPGDSLRLTATGTGRALALDLDQPAGKAFAPDRSGVPGQVFVVAFPAPGERTVVARVDGIEVGRLAVHIPQVDLRGPIACHIGYQRVKDVAVADHGADVALVANEPAFMLVTPQTRLSDGWRLGLRPMQGGVLGLQARLGAGGPIIAECPVDEFVLRTTAEKSISLVETLSDGKRILEAQLVMSPLVPGLDVRLSPYTAGFTFEDSSLEAWFRTDAFLPINGDGYRPYRVICTPGAAACHRIEAFQAGTRIMEK